MLLTHGGFQISLAHLSTESLSNVAIHLAPRIPSFNIFHEILNRANPQTPSLAKFETSITSHHPAFSPLRHPFDFFTIFYKLAYDTCRSFTRQLAEFNSGFCMSLSFSYSTVSSP